jgi:ech hydrogenase subunit D
MDAAAFLEQVRTLEREGFRLLMINATALRPAPGVPESACEVLWSFEQGGALRHLREQVTPADPVPSVSGIYPFAYLYENELRELFGLDVTGLNVDFKGQLYGATVKVPMSPSSIRKRLEAAAALKAAAGQGKKP